MVKSRNENGELEEVVVTKLFKKEWKEVNLFKIQKEIPNIALAHRKWVEEGKEKVRCEP